MLVSFASCNKDNTVKSDPDYIVLKCGESETVNLIGPWDVKVDHIESRVRQRQWNDDIEPNNDSIFSLSNIERKNFVVTGTSIGTDTLIIYYANGIHFSALMVEVPITVVE